MDPQKLASLDPKLREAYQRVMGTPIPQVQPTSVQDQAPPPPLGGGPTSSIPDPNPMPPPAEPDSVPTPIPQPEPMPFQTPTTPPPADSGSTLVDVPTIEDMPSQPIDPPVESLIPEPTIPEPQPSIPQPDPLPAESDSVPAGGFIPEPIIPPQQPPMQAANFVQMNSEVSAAPSSVNFAAPVPTAQVQSMNIKKKSHMMPILMGSVVVVFLVIYTLFWTKIFNFKLPFLP